MKSWLNLVPCLILVRLARLILTPCVISIITLVTSSLAIASLQKDVDLPSTTTVNRVELKLNGVGLRTATLFRLKVYAAGLYLQKLSTDPAEILESKTPKKVTLYFLRNLKRDQLVDAWKNSFKDNCGTECEQMKPALTQLSGLMTDVVEGELLSFTFFADSIEVSIKGEAPQKIMGEGFSKVLLTTWLGPNPPNGDLKKGMLGQLIEDD